MRQLKFSNLDGYIPTCISCGTGVHWEVSRENYQKDRGFWDNWKCQDCNPNYKGALERYQEARAKIECNGVPIKMEALCA